MSQGNKEWKEAEEHLISEYKRLFAGPPEWAFPSKSWNYKAAPILEPFPPTIPFIGENYFNQKMKIALYASAENLAHYERKPETIPKFLCDHRAWNRHRAANLEGWDNFFPRVHIGPVENGSLLCAALFICNKLGLEVSDNPNKFLETLLVANVGKFSLAGKTNKDYASNEFLLDSSLSFLEMDLNILTPDIIIIPKTIFKHNSISALVSDFVTKDNIIPVPQFNFTVVNTHLKKHDVNAKIMAKEMRGSLLSHWTNRLNGYGAEIPFRYYVELESLIIAN